MIEAFRSADAEARYKAAYDALLADWPVEHETFHIGTKLGQTHVLASGRRDAPPLVLLHAFMATALVWRPNVEALSRQFRIYAVDIIGQGGRSASTGKIRSRQDYANWLSEVLDGLGVQRASLVGSSYGGFLALNQAVLAPGRVDRVVLVNPAGVFVALQGLFVRMLASAFLSAIGVGDKGKSVRVESFLGRNVELGPGDRPWAELVSIAALEREMRPNAIFPPRFSKAELAAIQAPTLLLMGDNDLLYDPLKTMRRARSRMRSLECDMVEGAHHIAALARPEFVNARLVWFLKGPSEAPRTGSAR